MRNDASSEITLGSGQVVAFVLVSLVLIGLAFSLGLKAGQSLAEETVCGAKAGRAAGSQTSSDRLAALDAQAKAQQEARAQAEGLTFTKELTRTAEPMDGAQTADKSPSPSQEASKEAAAAPSAEKTASGASKTAASSASSPAASKDKSAEPAKSGDLRAAFSQAAAASSADASKTRTGFALQTASVPSEKTAKDEVRRLTSKGLSAWYTTAEVRGTKTYRIKVGPYATKDAAQADKARVAEKCGGQPIIANAD